MNLIELVAGVFKPTVELIDELHTSEEERLEKKAKILDVQAQVLDHVITYEQETLKAKAGIITAEANSEHKIAAIWRPVVMLAFCGLAVGDALGVLPNPLAAEAWTLLQIGIGGYVVSRGGEKIAKSVMQAKVTGE